MLFPMTPVPMNPIFFIYCIKVYKLNLKMSHVHGPNCGCQDFAYADES